MKDPYAVLGVSENATEAEITKAYRTLARKYHPDLNPGDNTAEAKMKEINTAYEQIKDIKSRGESYSANTGASSAQRASEPFTNGGYDFRRTYYYYDFSDPEEENQRNRQTFRVFNPFRIFFRITLFILIIRLISSLIFGGIAGLFGGYRSRYYEDSRQPYSYSYEEGQNQ